MDIFEKLKLNPAMPPFEKKKGSFVCDDTVGIALLLATNFKKHKDNYLVVAANLYKAQQIYNILTYFINKDEVMLFPADELIRAETIAQSKEMVAQRLYVLNEVKNDHPKIIVSCVASATRYLPDPEEFNNATFEFKVGESYDLIDIKRRLAKAGYLNVNKIDATLEFAVRGDILDIFSVNMENPVRIEFFGDEVESIRFFDIASQTSLNKVDKVTILPGSDVLLTEQETLQSAAKINKIMQDAKGIIGQNAYDLLEINTNNDISHILEGNFDDRTYKYYSLISEKHFSIFDYCKNYTKVLVSLNQLMNSNTMLQEESWQYLNDLYQDGKIINHLSMYQDINRLVKTNVNGVITTEELFETFGSTTFDAKLVPFTASKKDDCLSIIRNYLNEDFDIILAINSKDEQYTIQDVLDNVGISYESVNELNIPTKTKVGLSIFTLPHGFVLPTENVVVLTSAELFNIKTKGARFDNKFKEATILKSFEDLTPGDYVVHEYQGIGQFLQLQTLEVDGVHKDFLKIAYSGDSILYVPLNQFQLVRKYMGKEGYKPRLSHLHSKDWENTKKKIKERINDLANRLMNLYIERAKVKGYAFPEDDEFQTQFEDAFEHDLTVDQERAIQDIKKDMESDHPMDRLLCGDVGFGKTEVAFRAAFKAINSGKQVAILCPTTLLARQHYELALQRFGDFDIKVGILSRLVPEKDQKKYMEQARSGELHLLIGTHRLLSKDLCFKDLGLLIIDEEQRFGVEQKERIKELKSNLDVLTLSATPIPRTLQISLLGVRSLSQINTPPLNRMPIQTYVTPFKWDVVKELIEREFGRNGQVFFLHNEVATIYNVANKLQKLLPNAVIGVAHGQMPKSQIEDVMIRFYNGEINLLVCTSIVENGIDVPNANMIIVQDSDKYGLSQLYQIKGRVGRSDRIAYAYLMYPEHKVLKDAARKRLKALQDFTELGSGYKIAQRDLMIRGAGDILGPEQAGFIDSIGLDMYIKLLNESVQNKLAGKDDTEELPKEFNVNLAIDAFIPSSYASDSDKIELYQEINSAVTAKQLASVKYKTIDIYGKLPKEVELLFKKRNIDILIKQACVKSMQEFERNIEIILSEDFTKVRGIGNILFEALIPFISFIKIAYRNHEFRINLMKRKTWVNDLEAILKALENIVETNNIITDLEVLER